MSAERSLAYVPAAGDSPDAATVGGKGKNLVRLAGLARELRFRVPRFIVIPAQAFDCIVVPAVAGRSAAGARAAVRELAVPAALRSAVLEALATAGLLGARVAVRSSAVAEDSGAASFAGQFDTVLGVEASDCVPLWDAIRRVWASAFNPHAAAYAQARAAGAGAALDAEAGAREPSASRMAVVIQELVEPLASGVAFSVDPVAGARDVAVVSAVPGLSEGLVSGELDADTYRVSEAGLVTAEIAHKDRAVRALPGGGTALSPVPEPERDRPVLADADALRVAASARAIAAAEGTPQDVEWALAGAGGSSELVILQTRPITPLGRRTPPAPGAALAPAATERAAATGARRVWDNSNIVESYSGVTTPLTFSFARGVYEDVYRQFCRVMGVPDARIESQRAVFVNMLGLVRGRVYYNLLHWYRTLALLPGFRFNRGFMERMMGVREALEDPPAPPGTGGRIRDLAALVRVAGRMLRESRRLDREVPKFHARVDAALAGAADLAGKSEAELVATYRRLEDELLRHWRTPLVNDFFAMIDFGVLCRMIERWLPDAAPTLANDLLCGEGEIISTAPARQVMALARLARETPAVAAGFAAESEPQALLARLAADPACAGFHAAFRRYVERFGDRCLEELKLETLSLRENPAFLVHMIRSYAERGTVDAGAQAAREAAIRRDAEARVRAGLDAVRRAVFVRVLRGARARVRDRENLRFERTRVFGVVRRLFLALGMRFTERGLLDDPRDVVWLTVGDVFEAASGELLPELARARVAERRAMFQAWERGPAPPERFETRGTPPIVFGAESADPGAAVMLAAPVPGERLQGTACCPGVVRERVRVVRDAREARDVTGRILVAERTDPGWTLLFPAVRGLLVQRGSLLSHSAIVAREMGLPCVVGIKGLLDGLVDGELVEMDGASGRVTRLERGES